VPESENSRSRGSEGSEEQDSLLQPKYDGSVGPRFGKIIVLVNIGNKLTLCCS